MKPNSQIKAYFLAILTFFSSVFVSIDAHSCCGKIVDLSIFGEADVCEMDMISCKTENTSIVKIKGNCCHNSKVYKPIENFDKCDIVQIEMNQFEFAPSIYFNPLSFLYVESYIHYNYTSIYRPPLITKDIMVLIQRFLI